MRIRFECEVEGFTLLQNMIDVNYKDKTYSFIPNDKNYLSKIQIVAKVHHPEKFDSTFRIEKTNDPHHTVTIKQDMDLMNEIKTDFQELESILSLTHRVMRIRWEKLKYDLIFETDEDYKITTVSGYALEWNYPETPHLAEPKQLGAIVHSKEKLGSLTVPLSFWREGIRDFHQHRYINAFYNFYFILEVFFGGGQWRNYKVGQEFLKSDLNSYIDSFLKNKLPKNLDLSKRLTEMIDDMNINNTGRPNYKNQLLDVEGIITLVINTRGSLLHYNPATTKATPFSHREYRHIAFMLLDLTTVSLIMKLGKAGVPITMLMKPGQQT